MKKWLILLFVSCFGISTAFAYDFTNIIPSNGTISGSSPQEFSATTSYSTYDNLAFGPIYSGDTFPVANWYGFSENCGAGVGGGGVTSGVLSYELPSSLSSSNCGTQTADWVLYADRYVGGNFIVYEYYKFHNTGTWADPVWVVLPGAPPFLGFPLECSTPTCSGGGNISYVTNGAYTASSVISVFDHNMQLNPVNGRYPYTDSSSDLRGLDGVVTSWNNEVGTGTAEWQGCYQKESQTNFNIVGTYVGDSCGLDRLNYDDHPGYDYKAAMDTPVYAVAGGTIVVMDCPLNGSSCVSEGSGYGRIGIDHGNGYTSWYTHLSSQYGGLHVNDHVDKGQPIGYSGDTGVSGSPHLHFQVTKGSSIYDLPADPYGWTGGGTDPYETTTGVKNVCLWESGCP